MGKPIVFLAVPGSPLADEVGKHFVRNELQYYKLSLDAPLEGKPVTVAHGRVVWEGVDLSQAGVIFLEKPVFPWPQAELPPPDYCQKATYKQWNIFQREAASLIVSAVFLAGESQGMINRPAAAHLAISPSIALDRLDREGINVHPWRLMPAPSLLEAGFILDASGRDRWHSPTVPRAGEPALVYTPFSGDVVTVMVIGGKSVGALRYRDGECWATHQGTDSPARLDERNEVITGPDWPEALYTLETVCEARDLAIQAAKALDLDLAAVTIRTGTHPPAVLLCEAGPDLVYWNRVLEGRIASALAEHLLSASAGEGSSVL